MKTIAMMIRDAINRKGFATVKECAQSLDLPYELLRKVVGEDHIPKDPQLVIYAKKLGIDPRLLLFTAYHQKAPSEFKEYFEKHVIREAPVAINKVPTLTWSQVGKSASDIDKLMSSPSKDYVGTNLQGKHLFSLRITDDSMSPYFLVGEAIIIDAGAQAQPGDYIVIKHGDSNEVTLRQLKRYNQVSILHPLNPKYEDRILTEEIFVIGKVVRKQKDFLTK